MEFPRKLESARRDLATWTASEEKLARVGTVKVASVLSPWLPSSVEWKCTWTASGRAGRLLEHIVDH